MDHRSPTGRYILWRQIIEELRKRPDTWAVKLGDEPARLVRTVRDRSNPALHLTEGRVEARIVNEYTDTGGHRRGDIYLRYLSDSAKLPE